jgi:CO/xanthine dehydrogenase Mo-binding subunit
MAQSPSVLGTPHQRVDGKFKVTGTATYASDFKIDRMAYACLIQSTIASGTVIDIDQNDAERVPGVLAILTRGNAPKLQALPDELAVTEDPARPGSLSRTTRSIFRGSIWVPSSQRRLSKRVRLLHLSGSVTSPASYARTC